MEKDIINTNHEEECEDSFSIPVELDFTEFDKKLAMIQEALSEALSNVLAQAIANPDSNLDLKELLSDENTSDEEKNFADYEYEKDNDYDEEDNIYNHRDKTSRSSHFTPLFGRHKSQSSHESTSRNASSYNPFDTHGESSFDWTDRDGDGYDDRDDGFWTEREF